MSDCCTSIYGLKKQQVRRQEDNMGKNIDWSNLGFGYVKTDYRYVSNFKNGAWDEGTLSTDDMVTISECACVLQYAQTVFEGMKAYTTEDGRIVVFRPDLNAERMENSAKRLEMPVFPKDRFVDAIVKLVEANADYVPPYGSGATLYIRPYMFGTNAVIGVKPADEYQFRAFCTPVGPYFKGGVKPITIRVSDFDRAAPRGTGHIKAGLNYANGNDLSLVAKKDFVSPIKSVGHGITTVADLEKPEQVWPVFLELTQDIGHKLRVHGLSAEGF